jgi:hypothetical protein
MDNQGQQARTVRLRARLSHRHRERDHCRCRTDAGEDGDAGHCGKQFKR